MEWTQSKAKMVEIKAFNLKDIHQYDDNVFDLEMGNLAKVSRRMVGSISTPFGSQATWMWSWNCWEVLKVQLTLNKQAWVPCHKLFLLWHFFVVNDDKKPNPLTTQTTCCLVCHFVYNTCDASSTTKKWKVWFPTTNNMALLLWRNTFWHNIQLFSTGGRLLI